MSSPLHPPPTTPHFSRARCYRFNLLWNFAYQKDLFPLLGILSTAMLCTSSRSTKDFDVGGIVPTTTFSPRLIKSPLARRVPNRKLITNKRSLNRLVSGNLITILFRVGNRETDEEICQLNFRWVLESIYRSASSLQNKYLALWLLFISIHAWVPIRNYDGAPRKAN